MLIDLDLCSLQRPLDDRAQLRVALESEAVLGILAVCESGQAELVSSEALRYESERNPNPVRRVYALGIIEQARVFVPLTPEIEERAKAWNASGLRPLDALHVASAVQVGADYFCTCDDRVLKQARAIVPPPPRIVSPLELIAEIGP